MKIKALKLKESLLEEGNLSEAIEEKASRLRFANQKLAVDQEACYFDECLFENVKLSGKMQACSLIDVVFLNCDLSLLDIEGSFLRRVRFERCRMNAFNAISCRLEDVVVTSCNCMYANFNEAKIKNVLLESSSFVEAGLAMMDNKGLAVEGCDFCGAEFFDTSLSSCDFSTSKIEGIVFRQEDLKGMTVNAVQAVGLVEALGVKVQ